MQFPGQTTKPVVGVKFGGINIAYEDKGFHFIEIYIQRSFRYYKKDHHFLTNG
jgi:hypothetical protein